MIFVCDLFCRIPNISDLEAICERNDLMTHLMDHPGEWTPVIADWLLHLVTRGLGKRVEMLCYKPQTSYQVAQNTSLPVVIVTFITQYSEFFGELKVWIRALHMTIVIILIFNLHRLEHHFNQYCVLMEHCHGEWKNAINYFIYLFIFFHHKENNKKENKWKNLGKSDLMLSRKISTNSTFLLSFHWFTWKLHVSLWCCTFNNPYRKNSFDNAVVTVLNGTSFAVCNY